MDHGTGAPSQELSPDRCAHRAASRMLLCGFLLALAAAGCASPSEPYERKPPVPLPVSDLAATQAADDIVLTFTLPTETVDHRPFDQALTIEIYRGIGDPRPAADAKQVLLATIPSGAVDQYVQQGRFRYSDSVKPDDFAQRAAAGAVYSVRTRAAAARESDSSNVAYVSIHPALEPIADLKTDVTHAAIVLAWSPPEKTLAGAAPSAVAYRIYRAEADSTAAGESPKPKAPLAKIGESESPSFQDTQFEFGKTYVYSVRGVVGSGTDSIESADSNLAVVAARDVFPPAAPQGLVAALVPQQADVAAHLELSWAVGPETDVAGYNVYRSEQAGAAGTRLTTELLLTPAFRDMNVQPGHRYFYTVTAVDRSGNESRPSEAVSGGVPAESQPNP